MDIFDAQKGHMKGCDELRDLPCCSLQYGGWGNCVEIRLMEISGTGYSGIDMETSPSFPFSQVSAFLHHPQISLS